MSTLNQPRVFVVDDHHSVAECVSDVLREAGYSVDISTDSREALKRVTEDTALYGVLISDNNMPNLSGRELIEAVRKAGFQGKIVMYSGSVSPDEELLFKSIGTDVVLRKPFDFKLLVPTIEDLCGHGGSDQVEPD